MIYDPTGRKRRQGKKLTAPPGPPIDHACPLLPFVPTTVPASRQDNLCPLRGYPKPATGHRVSRPLRTKPISSRRPAPCCPRTPFLHQAAGCHANPTHGRPPTLLNRMIMPEISTKRKCLLGQCRKFHLISRGSRPPRLPRRQAISRTDGCQPAILSPYVKKL